MKRIELLIFAAAILMLYPHSAVAQEKCVLDNGKIRAVFHSGDTFTVEEIVMDGHKVAGSGSFAFWDLTLLGPMGETPVYRPKVARYQGAVKKHDQGVQSYCFTWFLRLDYSRGNYPLRAVVSLPDDGDRLYFNLEAELPDGWMVTNVTYPELTLCRPEGAKVIIPEGWGLEAPLSAAGHKAIYPTSAMQFLMVHNADGALFFGTEDPSGSRKVYGVDGNVDMHLSLDVPASEAWTRDGMFTLPFAVNLGFDRAGWEHAVTHWYKPYTYTLPWGGEERKIKNRLSTLSPWLQQTEGWVRLKTVDDEFDALDKAADLLGPHLSAHWYWWHQIEYDTHYPEYLPARPGFAQRVAQIHKKGVHVTPYMNGRLWDPHSESYARDGGKDASVRKMDGTLYTEIYRTSCVVNSVTCPYTKTWHDKLCSLVESIQAEYGVDGVYIDQVGCTVPVPCWNPSHGHPRGGGSFWVEGYQRILRDIRRDHLRPGGILTTEENGECYSDLFDMMLMVNSLNNDHLGPLKIVPVFPMVYSDRIITSAFTALPEVLEVGVPSTYRFAFAKALLYGAQPGWVRAFIITDPKFAAEAAYLRKLMDFRSTIHDIVLGGEFVREFTPGGANPKRSFERYWEETAVLGAEWRDRDGKPAFILVNTDPEAHRVLLPKGASRRRMVTVPADGAIVVR